MSKRRIITLALAIVAVLGGIIWWAVASRPPTVPDPVYGRFHLSEWLSVYSYPRRPGSNFDPDWGPFYSSLDSNAVPYLVHALKAREGALHAAYDRFWPDFPNWLKQRLPDPDPESEATATMFCCIWLGDLKTAARPAIPELIRVLREDDDAVTRGEAAWALGCINNQDDRQVVEALLAAVTKDTDSKVRQIAGNALWIHNPEAAAKAGIRNPTKGTPTTINNSAATVR